MSNEAQIQKSHPEPPSRPFLLGMCAGVLTLQAVCLPLLALAVLFWSSDSVVRYNGVESPMGEVRLKVLGMLVVWFAFAAYFGPGLWRGSALARRALFALCLVSAAAGVVATIVGYQGKSGLVVATANVGLSNVFSCGILWWYLYMKRNVREFFERGGTGVGSGA